MVRDSYRTGVRTYIPVMLSYCVFDAEHLRTKQSRVVDYMKHIPQTSEICYSLSRIT